MDGERTDKRDADVSRSELAAAPIIVVGKARSGTSWVHDIFNAHPEVAGIFESQLFTAHHGLGSLLSAGNWGRPHTGLEQFMSRDEMVSEVRRLAADWMSRVMEPQHRFVVEKSPQHHRALPVIAEIFPDARVVHVLRDGRDVAVSVRAAARSWAPKWADSLARSRVATARDWAAAVAEVREAGDALGDHFMEVRYEDLRTGPHKWVHALFEFAAIPATDDLVDQIVSATDFEAAHGDKAGEDSFFRGGRVGDWRSRFGLIDSALFELGAGSGLRQTGYESRPTWWIRRRRP